MLIIDSSEKGFNTDKIKRGTLIWAKRQTWMEGISGIVTEVTGNEITVQYPPDIASIINHFFIRLDEVLNGDWIIRYTTDLKNISIFPEGGTESEIR